MKEGIVVLAVSVFIAALVTAGPVAAADGTAGGGGGGGSGGGAAGPAAAGKALYDKTCSGCHNNMAPKLGDKAAWAPRIKQGANALTATVIKGKGMMPPKGGASASDADIKAAVEYIISKAK